MLVSVENFAPALAKRNRNGRASGDLLAVDLRLLTHCEAVARQNARLSHHYSYA